MPIPTIHQLFSLVATLFCLAFPANSEVLNEIKLKSENKRFIFGIFAANKNRSNLLEEAYSQGIDAYNFNSGAHLDIEHKRLGKAWRFEDGWKEHTDLELPDVVYDYSFYTDKKQNRKDRAERYKDYLHQLGIPKINPSFCMEAANNKQVFAKVMHRHMVAHPHTVRFKRARLKKMLQERDILFLKPRRGSKGSGIMIARHQQGLFELSYRIFDTTRGWHNVIKSKLSFKSLLAEIKVGKSILGKTNKIYLIQEGIPVWLYHGEGVDIRINIQRNRNGVAQVAGRIVRVGGNLAQGGQLESFTQVLTMLSHHLNEAPEVITERLDRVALATFKALEKNCQLAIGEIGMDLVITPKGAPYIIEANDKPGYLKSRGGDIFKYNPQSMFHSIKAKAATIEMDDNRNKLLVDYAKYLFNNRNKAKNN